MRVRLGRRSQHACGRAFEAIELLRPPAAALGRAALGARDEAALKELISQPADPNAPVEASPELREIAKRLPALQAELRALEEAQARAATP